MATMTKTMQDRIDAIEEKTKLTLDDVRHRKCFDIMLPLPADADDSFDHYEYVTVNGKTVQIQKGVPVSIDYITYEALINSGRYAKQSILI